MFYDFIKGRVVSTSPQMVVVEAGPIGYRLNIAVNLYPKLHVGMAEVTFYVAFIVRENIQALYAFLSREERDLFEALLDVNGVGPKLALSLIGHLSAADLQQAVGMEDTAILSKVPGVGKKTAERLIIEMRDRISPSLLSVAKGKETPPASLLVQDAMSALIHLGYHQAVAEKAVRKILENEPNQDLAGLITLALKHIREGGKGK